MAHLRSLCCGGASLVLSTTSLALALAACDYGEAGGSSSDAGLVDSSPVDTGPAPTDASSVRNGPRLTVVNAAHDLGLAATFGATAAIRLCFKQGSVAQSLSVAPYPPLPDRVVSSTASSGLPGIYYGAGATFPTTGLDLAARIIVPVVMSSKSLAVRGLDTSGRPRTCDQLVGDVADPAVQLLEGRDYWVLPPIAAGTLANERSYVLALTGCAGDTTTPNPGKCGVGFVAEGDPGRGNLKLTIYETTRSPVAAPFGAQFLYVSTQAHAFFSQANAKGSIQPGFVSNAADGAGFRPIASVSPPVASLSAVVPVLDVKESDSFVLGPKSLSPSEAAIGVPLFASSLALIQQRSGLSLPAGGNVYANGQNYVFIAVGDPDPGETKPFTKADGTLGDGGDGSRFNERSFHFLAYPTDPVVEPYSPP